MTSRLTLSTSFVLAAALLFGGGQGWLGDQLLAIPACGLGLWGWYLLRTTLSGSGSPATVAWLVPPLLLVVPLWQLLPLPPGWFASLPGRVSLVADLQAAGVTLGWHAASVIPFETERVFWYATIPAGLFVATLALPPRQQRVLVLVALVFALLSATLGFAQLFEGEEGDFYFYRETNRATAIGFFANRNHLAALLAGMLPAVAGMLTDRARAGQGARDLGLWMLSLCCIYLVLGATSTQSRAGFLLLMVSLAFSVMGMVSRRRLPEDHPAAGAGTWLKWAGLIAVLVVVQYTLIGLLARLDQDPLEDLRWTFAQRTLDAAQPFAGTGAGLGTFPEGYMQLGEVVADLPLIVNHTHNDYLELWYEGGVPAMLALGCLLALVLWKLSQAWQAFHQRPPIVGSVRATPAGDEVTETAGLRLGAGLALVLFALHSTVDYPLRTTALAALAAVFAAILLSPPAPPSRTTTALPPAPQTPRR